MEETTRLAIEAACRRLSLEFARRNDAGEYEVLAGLFAEDGVLCRPLAPDAVLNGRAEILADMRRKPGDVITRHICTNILVDVIDDSRAKGSTYYTVYLQSGVSDASQVFTFDGTVYVGDYLDRYVRTRRGWRIAERRGRNRFVVSR